MKLDEMPQPQYGFSYVQSRNHSPRSKQGSEHRHMLVVSPDEAADTCCLNTEYRHISSVPKRFYDIASCLACPGNLLVIYCLHLSYRFTLQMLIYLGGADWSLAPSCGAWHMQIHHVNSALYAAIEKSAAFIISKLSQPNGLELRHSIQSEIHAGDRQTHRQSR